MSEQTRVLKTSGPPTRPRLEPVMRTPAHRLHAGLGARFDRLAQWEIPVAYGPVEVERAAIRDGLAIADVTPRGKVDLRGPIDEILARLPSGGDRHIAQVSARWALLLSGPGGAGRWLPAAEKAAGPSGMATDATCLYTGIALLGPNALKVLARLTPTNVSTLRMGRAAGLQVARIPAILVRGERATEVYAASEYGRYLWQTMLPVTTHLGGRAVGWDALRAEGWT